MKDITELLGKINCGDCLPFMRELPDKCIDLVLTDPPYGINRDKGFGGCVGFAGKGNPIARREYADTWDSEIPNSEVFNQIFRVSKNAIIWGGNFFAHMLPPSTHYIYWDKLQTMPTFGDGEIAYSTFPRKSIKKYVFEYNGLLSASEDKREHPTQKPSELMEWILRDYSKPTDIIFDPYLGSGSNAVACERLGRKWLACEISEAYCKVSQRRIDLERAQGKLF